MAAFDEKVARQKVEHEERMAEIRASAPPKLTGTAKKFDRAATASLWAARLQLFTLVLLLIVGVCGSWWPSSSSSP